MRSNRTAQLLCSFAAAAILSACASKTQVSSQQESTRYLSRAGRDYTAPGPSSDPWGPYVKEAASRYDVPEKWIREVMRQESGGRLFGRSGKLITSGAGAMGLMQVMPATYDELRARYRELGDDPYDPHNNILAGTAYIREMYDIYGAPGFLAAYNAGPGRLDDYLTRNRTLPEETRRYVANIGPRIAGYAPATSSPGQQYAMNRIPMDIPAGPRYAAPVESAPIQLAEAPRPVIKLNPPAAEPVRLAVAGPFITLNPPAALPLPEPEPEPIQVAEAAPAPSPIQLAPPQTRSVLAPLPEPVRPPLQYARVEPPRPRDEPSRSLLAARPAPMPRMQFARLPEPPPLPEPTRYAVAAHAHQAGRYAVAGRPIEVAEFPEPPRPPRATQHLAAAELVPVAPHGHWFPGLIGSANAAPARHAGPVAATSGAWAVQVGAFANQGVASAATAAARDTARDVLGGARPVVAGVHQQGATLYRARLTGLSRDAAAQACERLSRSRTSCMVVSPDAR